MVEKKATPKRKKSVDEDDEFSVPTDTTAKEGKKICKRAATNVDARQGLNAFRRNQLQANDEVPSPSTIASSPELSNADKFERLLKGSKKLAITKADGNTAHGINGGALFRARSCKSSRCLCSAKSARNACTLLTSRDQ